MPNALTGSNTFTRPKKMKPTRLGDVFLIFFFHFGDTPTFKLEEQLRPTQIIHFFRWHSRERTLQSCFVVAARTSSVLVCAAALTAVTSRMKVSMHLFDSASESRKTTKYVSTCENRLRYSRERALLSYIIMLSHPPDFEVEIQHIRVLI